MAMIAKFLSQFPDIDRAVRHWYLRAAFPRRREPGFSFWIDPRAVLRTPWDWAGVPTEAGDLFFGYYDKSPWSPDGMSMVLHFRKPEAPEVEIRVFHSEDHTCQTAGRSGVWSFQQGAMTQWISQSSTPRLIYNDIADAQLVARIVLPTGKEESVIPMPVQAVHPGGQIALSLNYKRLWKLRREYGYAARVRNFSADMAPDRDGIWLLNLISGECRLIITLAELAEVEPPHGMSAPDSKVNHIIFSPGGTRSVFMHRWFYENTKFSRLYVVDTGTFSYRLILDSGLVSHYHWLDDERLIIYGNTPDGRTGYFELNVLTGAFQTLADSDLARFGDGHPSVSPDKLWLVTDTYPDRRFQQHLLIYHFPTGQLAEVGRFLHSPRYYAVTRCDLHPRWNCKGDRISFDSVWNGTRQSYILDVTQIVQARR